MSDKKESRRRAKKMLKNSKRGYIRNTRRIFKYGARGFSRNLWLSAASILVLVISLLSLIFTAAATAVLQDTAKMMKEKVDNAIFLRPGVSEEVLEELAKKIQAEENTKEVAKYSSREEAKKIIEEYKKTNEDKNIVDILQEPEQFQALLLKTPGVLRFKVYDVEKMSGIKKLVETDSLFLENLEPSKMPTFDTNKKEIDQIVSWASMVRVGGVMLAAVFLVISILIIFNTVRMAIFSRREEIYMMKLVGADKRFIRGPFLLEVQIAGILSAIVAGGLGYVAIWKLLPSLENYGVNISTLKLVLESSWLAVASGAVLGLAVIIPTLAARMAIRKYLK